MNKGAIWALICALLWTAGMLYFDWKKKKK
jgi:hypothetical protein